MLKAMKERNEEDTQALSKLFIKIKLKSTEHVTLNMTTSLRAQPTLLFVFIRFCYFVFG